MHRLRSWLALPVLLLTVVACSDNPSSGPSGDACGADGTVVSSADELSDALDDAGPGDTILLTDGTYAGHFVIATSGSADEPITLCGTHAAELDGGSTDAGYTLHLDGASYWRLRGFSVTGGQKGLMLDGSSHNVVSRLRIGSVGDEALHLRSGSSDNRVEDTTISKTGLDEAMYGEGIYVGSAQSNWCDISYCKPDRSNGNVLVGNTVSLTTAEAVDVKEGTTGGEIRDNRLSGPSSTAADSAVDLKGNDWVVRGNRVRATGPDGIQIHVVVQGWGAGNQVVGNSFQLTRPGYAVHVVGAAEQADNVVGCHQRVTPAGVGEPSNVPCR